MTREPETLIQRTKEPVTIPSLVGDLRALGVPPGEDLLVHSSLSSLGWVNGGAVAVIRALLEVIGPDATLVMPAHSGGLSDPAGWLAPPVPVSWWAEVRATMPPYEPEITPTREMGFIAESFRRWPGARRSGHPQVSFSALGPIAALYTEGHSLDHGLGEGSPLARLYDRDGWVLLLGVGHERNTSLHLAEYRAEGAHRGRRICRAPMLVDGKAKWVCFEDIAINSDDFPRIGADFASETSLQICGKVGCATALLMPQRALVDFAVSWLELNRP